MMDYQNQVYTTSTTALIAAGQNDAVDGVLPDAALKLSETTIDDGKWYRVIVEGDLDNNMVQISYYAHGDSYDDAIDIANLEPVIKSMGCFTEGRDKSIKQIKLMRTQGGDLYFDNIKFETEVK